MTIRKQVEAWPKEPDAEPYDSYHLRQVVFLAARLCTTAEVLRAIVDWAGPMQDAPRSARPQWFDDARALLAQLRTEGLT